MRQDTEPHRHLCLIYESLEEWRATVIPFIAAGLRRNEKCIYILSDQTADGVRGYLSQENVDVRSAERSGQLLILHETEVYTKQAFAPDRMIDSLIAETEKAIDEGYSGLRGTGEMSWALRDYPGVDRLLEYEARLNQDLFPNYPCSGICQYDRRRFDPRTIKGVLMTHPLLVTNNQVYSNFYYTPPGDFPAEMQAGMEVQHWLDSLERERQIQEARDNRLKDVLAAAASSAEQLLKYCQDVVVEGKTAQAGGAPLTAKETRILALIATGRSNKQIGELLEISEQTVKNRVSTMLRKLNASDRAHAVAIAMGHRWITGA